MDTNKYSKYFDPKFNFNNELDPTIKSKMNAMICKGNIMLEPRLQEYLNKKKYYKQNNIEPSIKLEDEYRITSNDKKILRSFLAGKTDIYKNFSTDDKSKPKKQYFPSKSFREDPRLPETIKTKKKQNFEKPLNRGMFVPDNNGKYYEEKIYFNDDLMLDARDFKFNEKDNNFNKNDDEDPRNQYIISNLSKKKKFENQKVNLSNNSFFEFDDVNIPNYSLIGTNDKINFNKSYGNFADPIYSHTSDLDFSLKTVTPTMATKGKNIDTSRYKKMPYFNYDNNYKDSTIETTLMRGISSNSKAKSCGFQDTEEHFYQYIDEKEINPLNGTDIGMPRGGFATRMDNKKTARSKEREIY
ncbi:Hypothetical protein KVN_LOCUS428 [uncultured virus]|nr:Hypothetical protein KVN_LOCUS428 [uncultured virus]